VGELGEHDGGVTGAPGGVEVGVQAVELRVVHRTDPVDEGADLRDVGVAERHGLGVVNRGALAAVEPFVFRFLKQRVVDLEAFAVEAAQQRLADGRPGGGEAAPVDGQDEAGAPPRPMCLHEAVDEVVEVVVERLLVAGEGDGDRLDVAFGQGLGQQAEPPVAPERVTAVAGDVLADWAAVAQPGAQLAAAVEPEFLRQLVRIGLAGAEPLDPGALHRVQARLDASEQRCFVRTPRESG
jgi:hypothetical protein